MSLDRVVLYCYEMKRYYLALLPVTGLLLLFALSVMVRLPWFGVDYVHQSRWTEYNRYTNSEVYVHTGYVFDLYEKYTVSEHMFGSYIANSPVFPMHKDLPLHVYTSFSPTVFIVPYLLFHYTGYSYVAMQLFSLAIALLTILLLYWLVVLLTKNRWLGLAAGAMYLFATGSLQNNMNVYWAHQLLQPVFIASLILFVKRQGLFRWWEALLIGLLLSIITWTGVISVVGFVLYGLWKLWQTRDKRYISYLWMITGAGAALLAIVVQVLLVTGTDLKGYLEAVSGRAAARSAMNEFLPLPRLLIYFFQNLLIDFGAFLLIAIAYAHKLKLSSLEWGVLFISTFPLLESFILLEHDTTYGFGRLKWLLPVVLLICLAAARLKSRKVLYVLVGIGCLIHLWLFTEVYKLIP